MTGAPGITLSGHADLAGQRLFGPMEIEIRAGAWTCLLGPSGIGKSTILRLIAGLETGAVFTGEITAGDGAPLAGRIAYMAQSDLLFPWLDVTDNVLTGARLRGEVLDRARAAEVISEVGLTEHAHKRPRHLSGGMRQRVALARTLMEDRPVVLLDEPFSALDARTRTEMQELAARVLAGRTVLLVTHDPAEAARLGAGIYAMTGSGIETIAPPGTAPIRAIDDPAVFACQNRLLALLREPA
ncbi:MAG: ABC transporter ATP-binding protein [Pseudomonadota bacterium]